MERLGSQREINLYKEPAVLPYQGEPLQRSRTPAAADLPLAPRGRQALTGPGGRCPCPVRTPHTSIQRLDTDWGPWPRTWRSIAVLLIHANPQPGNLNHIPPSGTLALNLLFCNTANCPLSLFSRSFRQLPTDRTGQVRDVSSAACQDVPAARSSSSRNHSCL